MFGHFGVFQIGLSLEFLNAGRKEGDDFRVIDLLVDGLPVYVDGILDTGYGFRHDRLQLVSEKSVDGAFGIGFIIEPVDVQLGNAVERAGEVDDVFFQPVVRRGVVRSRGTVGSDVSYAGRIGVERLERGTRGSEYEWYGRSAAAGRVDAYSVFPRRISYDESEIPPTLGGKRIRRRPHEYGSERIEPHPFGSYGGSVAGSFERHVRSVCRWRLAFRRPHLNGRIIIERRPVISRPDE